MAADFALDPRLAADTAMAGDLAISRVLLMDDARFPWLILVPRVADVSEIFDLDETVRESFLREVTQAAPALKAMTKADKINIGALGNIVPQLHIHVVARRRGDAAWPGPVWGAGQRQPYEAAAREALLAQMRAALGIR